MNTGSEYSLMQTLGRHPVFRSIWLAGLFSMIGSWMQNLGAAWLMTDLSTSPLMVALVQSMQMIPTLFLAFIAGALADMIDRRRFLLTVMAWQIVVTVMLAGFTQAGLVSPIGLLALTFALGMGAACQMPAMSATIQDIVPREEVVNAVTLGSLSMNMSRLVGPAAAGVLIGIAGVAPAFLVNAFSYLVFMVVVYRWSGPPLKPVQKQSLWSNISAGVRYAKRAKRFQAVLVRGSSHFLFASANMALLPLLVRAELGVGPEGLGTLVGAIGVGAIITALGIAPYLNRRFSRDTVVSGASLVIAATLLGVGHVHDALYFAVFLFFYGGAWMLCMLSFQVAAQMVLPAWVRGRGLSMTMMSFTAGMAGGGILWGSIASATDLETAFTASAVALLLSLVVTFRFRISSNDVDEA